MNRHLSLDIIPRRGEFDAYSSRIEAFAFDAGLSDAAVFKLMLALDEIVTNIVEHGQPNPKDGPISVAIDIDWPHLRARITDMGPPFNPITASAPELETPMQERKRAVGGMGIHLTKSCMQGMSYAREDGKNILTMNKRLDIPLDSPPRETP